MKAVEAKSILFGLFNEAIRTILILREGRYGSYTSLYCICVVHYASSSKAPCNGLNFIPHVFAVKMTILIALTRFELTLTLLCFLDGKLPTYVADERRESQGYPLKERISWLSDSSL